MNTRPNARHRISRTIDLYQTYVGIADEMNRLPAEVYRLTAEALTRAMLSSDLPAALLAEAENASGHVKKLLMMEYHMAV